MAESIASESPSEADQSATAGGGGRQGALPAARGLTRLLRLVAYARPYLALLLLALCFTLLFAAGRYGRAYLTKPLLDEVLLPQQAGLAATASEAFRLPLPDPGPEAPPEAAARVDGARAQARMARFRELLWAALLIVVVVPVGLFGRGYCLQSLLGRVNIDIKQELAAKLMRLPISFHRRERSGQVLTRLMVDVDQGQRALQILFLEFVQALVMIGIGLAVSLAISWQLTLLTLLGAPPIVFVFSYFAGEVRRGARRRQEQLGEVTQRLLGILSGIGVIKAFRGESLEESAFRRETHKYFRRSMRVVKSRLLSRSLAELLNSGIGTGVLVLGALLVMQGKWGLSVGDMTAFAAILATTYRPIKTLSRGWPQLMESIASADRFFALLDAEEQPADPPDAQGLDDLRQGIRFRGVSFSYETEPVLRDLDLEIRRGEVVALVGPTGAGKSTLVDLLLRFVEPDSGSIELDGVDLRQLSRSSLLDLVALVSQEPFLFDATIRENVLYGRPDASPEELAEACRVAQLDEFVAPLADGLDTGVGEFGLRLSGGQRQRITIARALLKRSPILVFDEATSALDAKTERAVQDAIDALRGQRTVILVAHRLSTVRRADRIVVLEQGGVRQQGSHEELLAAGGLYRELVGLSEGGAAPSTSA